MVVYRLYYVYTNDGVSGACRTSTIFQTTNKDKIEKYIKDNEIDYVTELDRGQCNVFVYDYFVPTYEEIVDNYALALAKEDLEKSKQERKMFSEMFKW